MAKNANLHKAKVAKNDEFYTQRVDIENELSHYAEHFKDKVVYCNCDDPETSEFWQFFKRNFKPWGLKRLIATHYEPDAKNYAYVLEISQDTNGDGVVDWKDDPTITPLPCNGDFRSAACIELLKQADIVVTNPPFSLFREYVAQLIEYDKKFLIIGSMNAITYKEIFPLIKDGKIWTGYKPFGGGMNMIYPSHIFDASKIRKYTITSDGRYIVNIMGVIWFTNLDTPKRHEPLDLRGNHYYGNEEKYPKYDNYDAIECSKVSDIPEDYEPCWYKCEHATECEYAQKEGINDSVALCEQQCNGAIGVPITFIDKYCQEQFDIIGATESEGSGFSNGLWDKEKKIAQPTIKLQKDVDNREAVGGQSSRSKEQGARSKEQGARSKEQGARSKEQGARSKEQGARSKEQGARSKEQGARSKEQLFVFTREYSFGSRRKCNGIIGVPITMLDKYCPEQFRIVGLDRYIEDNPKYGHRFTLRGKETYARILIRKKM